MPWKTWNKKGWGREGESDFRPYGGWSQYGQESKWSFWQCTIHLGSGIQVETAQIRSVCGLWQTSSCWKWTLTQGSRSVQQVTSPLFLMGPKKTNYESQLNICICRRVEIANHHSRLMRLNHSETPNHPKLFTSTPPRLILFGHNPDPIPLLIWLWLHMYMV